jgi:hypothetical protein
MVCNIILLIWAKFRRIFLEDMGNEKMSFPEVLENENSSISTKSDGS